MKDEKISNATVINGVLLTDNAIAELKNWQEHDNENLQMHRETISDAVCFIGSILYLTEGNDRMLGVREQATLVISSLSSLREDLKKLGKP